MMLDTDFSRHRWWVSCETMVSGLRVVLLGLPPRPMRTLRAGGARGDPKIPEKVIPLAAKTVSIYVDDLDRRLSAQPAGVERRKFIMAACNGGVNLLATAQEEAIRMNQDRATWELLIRGGESSPLFEALKKTYKADTRVAKHKEVTEYIEKIFARRQ